MDELAEEEVVAIEASGDHEAVNLGNVLEGGGVVQEVEETREWSEMGLIFDGRWSGKGKGGEESGRKKTSEHGFGGRMGVSGAFCFHGALMVPCSPASRPLKWHGVAGTGPGCIFCAKRRLICFRGVGCQIDLSTDHEANRIFHPHLLHGDRGSIGRSNGRWGEGC